MGTDANDEEDQARQARAAQAAREQAGLTPDQVWFRYFSNGGDVGSYEIDAYLNSSLTLPRIDRDVLAHSINELIDELPQPPRAPYSRHLWEEDARRPDAAHRHEATDPSDGSGE